MFYLSFSVHDGHNDAYLDCKGEGSILLLPLGLDDLQFGPGATTSLSIYPGISTDIHRFCIDVLGYIETFLRNT
jgi:hypothetical protein